MEITDESTFTFGSSDNSSKFHKIYFGQEAMKYPVSKHGIKVLNNEKLISTCIVIGSAGATTVHDTCSIIKHNQLLICCCDTVFCLSLPDLHLVWQTESDPVTCFQIFSLNDGYVIHGEMSISKLSQQGKIEWDFGGKDIFVSLDNKNAFELYDNHIQITDFGGSIYKLGFDGKAL